MTTSPVDRLAIAAAALALVTALAGCSTGGSGSTSSGASPAAGSPSSSASAGSSGGSSADINACSLLSVDQATTLVAKYPYSASTPTTIAKGQDMCTYANTGPLPDMIVIVYQADSGVDFSTLTSASGATTSVSGVGDKAVSGDIELDVQAGSRLIAIQAAGGIGYDGNTFAGAIAVAKAVIAALG